MTIECTLREIPKSSFSSSPAAPMRRGRYSSSVFHIDGYGDTKWVVGCYIDVDFLPFLNKMTADEFVQRCVDHLNQPPERKKFERKRSTSLYGKLEVHSYKLKDRNGKRFVEVLLITDDPKNNYFWGEGVSYASKKRPRRRPRKAQNVFA